MSQQTVGFIDYVAQGGDTFDSIALVAYNEERMASTIIEANPDLSDVLIFEGGEAVRIPIVEDRGDARRPCRRGGGDAVKILYEGVDIYPDISVHRCYHDMYAEKQSDELLLKLNDTRELWDSWNPKKGDTIAIEDGAAKTGKMFVEGVVPESGIITLRAYSVPQSAKDKRSKSWEKVKFLQLAQEIASRHGLTLETYGITDQTYDYVEQNNLADFAFFQNRCTLEGAAFLVYDGKLVVYDEAYMESQQPVDTITPANDFEYRDEGTNAYGSAEAVNGGLTGTFAAPSGGDKVLRRILPFRMTDQSEADRFAKGLLRDANKNATVGTLWTGSLLRDYAAGSVVTLATEGVKSWDGTAFISRIRHDYVKTRSKLYLRKPLEGY